MNPDRITTRNLARKRSTWIVLALLAALVAGACTSARSGSGDGTAGEAADETTSDLATFADEPDPGPVAALEAAETAEGSERADVLVVARPRRKVIGSSETAVWTCASSPGRSTKPPLRFG